MKAKLLFIVLVLMLSGASAVLIEVEVPKTLTANLTSFSIESSKNLIAFKLEFYNSGSVSYTSRTRIDIFNDSQLIFTGWSEEKKFAPGDRKNFELYWFTNSSGNFSGRVRLYFANEILERAFNLEKNYSYPTQDVFTIGGFRTYDNFVVFDLRAERDVRNVVIIPENIPIGWIFQQKKIEGMKKGEVKTVVVNYKPAAWSEENLTLSIASEDGEAFTQEEVRLRKETGFLGVFYYMIDLLKLATRGCF